MKIRPISDAELANMMSNEEVLYRKDSIPVCQPERFDHLCLALKGFALKDQIRFAAGLIRRNERVKTPLPLDAVVYDGDKQLQFRFKVNATDEADWYATYDAFAHLFGDGTADESFRNPYKLVAIAGMENVITGKMQELCFNNNLLPAHFGVAEVERYTKEFDNGK